MELKRWSSNQKLEYWKDIKDYEGIYQVSSCGRIKSLERKVKHGNGFCTIKEKIIKPGVDSGGYLLVTLYANRKAKTFRVHRLVAIAFISNVENKTEVNHIDENKANNNVKNLEWMTREENNNWGTRNKRAGETISKARKGKYTGEKHPRARKVRCIETGKIFNTVKEACEWAGLKSVASITMCCQGKRKSAGRHPVTKEKLHWEYVDEVELDLNLLNIDNIKISL